MGLVNTFKFRGESLEKIKKYKYGTKWPVVYIIRNSKEAYIGESTRVYNRSLEHMKNKERLKLDTIDIVSDEDFNKSVALEFEAMMIEYMAADGLYKIQNGNSGQINHNYYQREKYLEKFETVWKELEDKKIVKRGLFEIRNSDMFKYSPYKTLTDEQYDVVQNIVANIKNNKSTSSMINGEPGTGKTIIAIYLMKYLVENDATKDMKIGLVVPMTSLRSTLKSVFKSIKNLKASMVLAPSDVIDNDYDILMVDEAHRLSRRVNIPNYGSFDNSNKKLNLGNEGTQLDWIRLSSKHIVLCYDKNQSIKPSDVRREDFENLSCRSYKITSQMRVLAGKDYIKYIENILNEGQVDSINFQQYELNIFNSMEEMHNRIKAKNEKYGLSRLIAGYAWEWKSNNDPVKYDFIFDNGRKKLRWNSVAKDWINSPNALNEVGCIHTTQGYDINYAGVIIGPELVYRNGRIQVVKENYYDKNGKNSIKNDEELKRYILNIYKTILTRGIRGTYIYICDVELRNYISKYIKVYNKELEGIEKDIVEEIVVQKI